MILIAISLHIDTKTTDMNNLFQYLNGSDDEEVKPSVDDGFTSVKSSKKNRNKRNESRHTSHSSAATLSSPAKVTPPQDSWENTPLDDEEGASSSLSAAALPNEHNELVQENSNISNDDASSSTPALSPPGGKLADIKLQSTWRYWTHEKHTQDWMINSFYKLIVFGTVGEFWRVHNNFDKISGLEARYYFMMRGDIEPTWEHPRNRNGIIWSVQVPVSHIDAVWERLCTLIVGETFVPSDLNQVIKGKQDLNMLINGISTVVREVNANKGGTGPKNTFYLIKIWLSRNVDIIKHITAALKDISDLRDLSIRPMQLRPEY